MKKKKKKFYHNEICTWKRDRFFEWSWTYKESYFNKDIKKESFKKDLTNLTEKNHQVNTTSDDSFWSNNSFKS